MRPLFDNIAQYEYFPAVKKLTAYLQSDYHKALVERLLTVSWSNKQINDQGMSKTDSDAVALIYTKCRANTRISVFISSIPDSFSDYYYKKSIVLTNSGLDSLVESWEGLSTCGSVETKTVWIVFHEGIIDSKWTTKSFYETVTLAELVLNPHVERFLNSRRQHPADKLVHQYTRWIQRKISSLDRERFGAMGGCVWHQYGIRRLRDLDFVVVKVPKEQSGQLEHQVRTFSFDKRTKHPKIDGGMEDSRTAWSSKWDAKNQKIALDSGAKSFRELFLDPQYYICYRGVKFWLPKVELVKKMMRLKSGDIADIAMLVLKYKDVIGTLIKINKDGTIDLPTKIDHRLVEEIVDIVQRKFYHPEGITFEIVNRLLKN